MTRETRRLLAELHFGTASPQDFADFALPLLEAGYDTPHLRMLTSLGNTADRADYDYYFSQTITKVGWTIPPADQLLQDYALNIAQDIVSVTITPVAGCQRLYQIHIASDYSDNLGAWTYLDDQMDPETYKYPLEGERWKEAIRHQARKMLQSKP